VSGAVWLSPGKPKSHVKAKDRRRQGEGKVFKKRGESLRCKTGKTKAGDGKGHRCTETLGKNYGLRQKLFTRGLVGEKRWQLDGSNRRVRPKAVDLEKPLNTEWANQKSM